MVVLRNFGDGFVDISCNCDIDLGTGFQRDLITVFVLQSILDTNFSVQVVRTLNTDLCFLTSARDVTKG